MTIANIEIPATTRNALLVIRDGVPTYVDLDVPEMAALFAPAVAAVADAERELRGEIATDKVVAVDNIERH